MPYHPSVSRDDGISFGFSQKAAADRFRAVEIGKAEFDRLVALRNERTGKLRLPVPGDSWVRNEATAA